MNSQSRFIQSEKRVNRFSDNTRGDFFMNSWKTYKNLAKTQWEKSKTQFKSGVSQFEMNKAGLTGSVKNIVGATIGVILIFAMLSVVFGQDSGVSELIDLSNISVGGSTYDFGAFSVVAVLTLIFGGLVYAVKEGMNA